jgi:hypothetical protein
MTLETDAWRAALRAKGRDWVMAELNLRAGQPEDPVYDIVHEAPYPTRAFCQRWCAEEDNKGIRLAGTTKAALIALLLFTIFLAMTIHSFSKLETVSSRGGARSSAASAGR